MVSVLDCGSSSPGLSPGHGHCVVFLGKTLYSQGASLHPGVQMGTRKNEGSNPAMDQHPMQGGGEGGSNTPGRFMLMKLELSVGPMGHLGLYKGFTIFFLSQ